MCALPCIHACSRSSTHGAQCSILTLTSGDVCPSLQPCLQSQQHPWCAAKLLPHKQPGSPDPPIHQACHPADGTVSQLQLLRLLQCLNKRDCHGWLNPLSPLPQFKVSGCCLAATCPLFHLKRPVYSSSFYVHCSKSTSRTAILCPISCPPSLPPSLSARCLAATLRAPCQPRWLHCPT